VSVQNCSQSCGRANRMALRSERSSAPRSSLKKTLNTAQMTSYSLLSLAVAWGTKTSVTRLMAASQWQGVIASFRRRHRLLCLHPHCQSPS
jgi:hypothetical protein